jgi:hypothetical protein
VVRRFLDDASDGGDLSVLDDALASDVLNHAARPGLQEGLECFRELLGAIHGAQRDRRWTQQRYVAEGDLVIVYGVREGYWTAANFRGVPTPHPGQITTELATCSAYATA